MPAFLSITTRRQGKTLGAVNRSPAQTVVNDGLPVWWTRSDFSPTPGGRSARLIVVTRFAGLAAVKTPSADVATVWPKQEKPSEQKPPLLISWSVTSSTVGNPTIVGTRNTLDWPPAPGLVARTTFCVPSK